LITTSCDLAEGCLNDLRYGVTTNRKTTLRDPYHGIGKPEHLRHLGGHVWSRRTNEADRLVYEVFEGRIVFLQARYHY